MAWLQQGYLGHSHLQLLVLALLLAVVLLLLWGDATTLSAPAV